MLRCVGAVALQHCVLSLLCDKYSTIYLSARVAYVTCYTGMGTEGCRSMLWFFISFAPMMIAITLMERGVLQQDTRVRLCTLGTILHYYKLALSGKIPTEL
jgi:hypothetical protein